MANKCLLGFILVLIQSQCQNSQVIEAPTSNATGKYVPITPTDKICKSCDCTPGLVDCHDKGIDKFFAIPDWSGVKDQKPTRVDLSLNKFTEVTPFPELSITVLDLSHGEIVSLKRASFKMLQSMVELDLSHNNITSAELRPDVFEGQFAPEEHNRLRSMRKLKLSYNSLHSLHQDLFEHLPELEELRLDGNPLTLLDHFTVVAISSLSYLKVLDLSNCQLKNLPESSPLASGMLEWLDLSSNEFQAVPPALENSTTLKYLSLSKNPIKYIEKDSEVYKPFPRMASLRELHLSYMPKLESIKKMAMSGLENLEVLHMRHNPALSFIDPTALQRHSPNGEGIVWPQIIELYLDHNNLSVIDSRLIGRWDYLTAVNVQENPYLCDCAAQWMVDSLVEIIKNTSYDFTPDIVCHDPIKMRGKSLVHSEDTRQPIKLCSVKQRGDLSTKDVTLLVGAVIGLLITIGLVVLYKRGYMCSANGPADFSRVFYKRAGT